jgi:hypothetical protein
MTNPAPSPTADAPGIVESASAANFKKTGTDERFGSTEEAATAHSALLGRVPEVLTPSDFQVVGEFIGKAVATGAVLNNADDRKQVQGLIDYWTASLLTAGRHSSNGTDSRYTASNAVLARFDRETVRRAAAAGDAWLAALSDRDRVMARRILLRLVRIRKQGSSFDPVPALRATLYDLDTQESVDAVVNGLVSCGLVRVTKGVSQDLDRMTLRFPELVADWPTYAGMLAERKRFREAVTAWQEAGRPDSALAKGDSLEDARSYFDRDNLEREYLEAARRKEWRENERNRLLKWVFLCLALAALFGWVTAAFGLRSANEHRRQAEAANAALAARRNLTDLRLLVRGMGELAAAFTPPEQEIAAARWKLLVDQYGNDPQFQGLNLGQLGDSSLYQSSPPRVPGEEVARIHTLRDEIFANPDVRPTFEAMRQVSFEMVRLSARKIVSELEARRPFAKVEPYVREFWIQYWGEMLLVEGASVENEMVGFGTTLARIQADAETDATLSQKFNSTVGPDLAKEKLQPRFNYSQVAAQAKKLGSGITQLVKDDFAQYRKTAIDRPVDSAVVEELKAKLKSLLKALDEESTQEMTAYHAK